MILSYCYLSKGYSWCKSVRFHCRQWIYTDIILFHLYLPSYLWFCSYISCIVTLFLPVSGCLYQNQIFFCKGFTCKVDIIIALGWSWARQVQPSSSSRDLVLIEEYSNEDVVRVIFSSVQLPDILWLVVQKHLELEVTTRLLLRNMNPFVNPFVLLTL